MALEQTEKKNDIYKIWYSWYSYMIWYSHYLRFMFDDAAVPLAACKVHLEFGNNVFKIIHRFFASAVDCSFITDAW